MKRILVTLSAALISLAVNAGQSTVTGKASVSKPVEYVTVSFNVKSECYKTPTEAMAANNESAAKIQAFLQTFLALDNPMDRLFTNGGTTSSYTRNSYEDGATRTTCKNTFQQNTAITFQTNNLKAFSTTFAAIQEGVLANFSSVEGKNDEALTFVSIFEPRPDICKEVRDAMSQQAKTLAIVKAKMTFCAMAQECGVEGNVEITSFGEEVVAYAASRRDYANAVPGSGEGSGPLMLNFQDVVVEESVKLLFTYPNTFFKCQLTN